MLFNSLQFLTTFSIVLLVYWQLEPRVRWIWVLVYSTYFYMTFVPQYILILGFTIAVDYWAGIWIERTNRWRRFALLTSLVANVGVLMYFKYANFFIENLQASGFSVQTLKIVLPIGLSFHTFQAMSYTIEVYRGRQKAERHFGIFALYVLFFPQLVAGPIERPQNILPQLHATQTFDWQDIRVGLLQMLWGLFKKAVIADRLALVVDAAYQQHKDYNGLSLAVAAVAYSFQIYGDFSGYSDIGIGAARTMGIRLMTNFEQPYTAQSVTEFWRRWHISLSTWFRDYVYIPLGGNRGGIVRQSARVLLVFLLSGFWHGASWRFVAWGALHGLLLVFERVRDSFFEKNNIRLPKNKFSQILNIIVTFILVTSCWVFFRANSFEQAATVLYKIFVKISLGNPLQTPLNVAEMYFALLAVVVMLFLERQYASVETLLGADRRVAQWRFAWVFGSLWLVVYFFGVFNQHQFIYFQF